VTLMIAPFWWPVLLLGALAWSAAALGTAIEPHWVGIALEYTAYGRVYEG